ncbi:ATP-dependent RNA helicase DDX19B, partial [Lemmus lemmus]
VCASVNDFPRGGAGPHRDPPEPLVAGEPASTAPARGTMATDSWALAVDEQEAAAESLSNLHLKEEKIKPDANGAVKTNANSEKTDEEEKEDRAAQSLLNKLIRSNLVDNTNQVEVLQRDPSSPLYSVKSFEELRLKPQLLQGVYAMGFNRPSKIQENALPLMLAEPPQNLIAQSQSGTGKTAAFVLAMLSQVEPANRYPQCLCLSPTYELALQTGKVIEQMGKFYPELKLAYAVRGNKLDRGQKVSEQIVIGTPGTVLDWCSKLKFIDPKKIKVFVLDEADVMIATQGHQDQSIRIQRMLPRNCQMLLFSATFEDSVWKFAQKVVPDPNIIKLKREEETLDTIKQYYVVCNNREEKFQALCNLYGAITIAQAMIFCHTRKTASWLAAELSKEGHQVALLSGEMMVEQRAAVIERFREGKEKVLVTTNVCARGIDVEQVSVVINFDLPVDKDGNPDGNPDNETYLHRIGRTGRFGKRGLAVNMVDSKHSMTILNRIQEHFSESPSWLCLFRGGVWERGGFLCPCICCLHLDLDRESTCTFRAQGLEDQWPATQAQEACPVPGGSIPVPQ